MTRFRDQFGSVLERAEAESAALRHDYVATEHLLLAVLRGETGFVAQVLERFGVAPETVRGAVLGAVAPGKGRTPSGARPLTSWAKKALEEAATTARQAGDAAVEPFHVLLGLLLVGRGVAVDVLSHLGLEGSAVLSVVRDLRGGANEG